MAKESVFRQAAGLGGWFSFVFYLFFMMSFLPIIMLFFGSLFTKNLPGLALPLVLGAILIRDVKAKRLYDLCRDMAVLNLTLWFLLGFFNLAQHFLRSSSGSLLYILLLPYGAISGYLVFYLLARAEKNHWKVLEGGVAVSTMIAIISAINGAVTNAVNTLHEQLVTGILAANTTATDAGANIIQTFNPASHSPHVAFAIVLIVFNIPFIRYYARSGKPKHHLLVYAIPIASYVILQLVWRFIRGLLLG